MIESSPQNLSETAVQSSSIRKHPLEMFFSPQSIAIIGASEKEGSVGRTIMWNLITSPFGGTVYPVNPKRKSIMGIRTYPSIKAVPEKVELAVIMTQPESIPGIIKECVEAGVKGVIIISAGFKETGAHGAALEKQIWDIAKASGMRIVGPNCLGIMRPSSGLNATFAGAMARKGKVGFISQSGALCAAVLDWSIKEHVGFSAFISIGTMLDVSWADLIDYLGQDPETSSIVIYMESIGDVQSFLSVAREVTARKPIIVIKAGRTEAAARAAISHTGSLVGSDKVMDAAFARCGVLRVDKIADLFYMADILAKQPRPKGPNLTIVTNAGGPSILAADSLVLSGGQLTPLSNELMDELNKFLPTTWSHNNPIDVIGDADYTRYAKTIEAVIKDPNCHGLLVILTFQGMTDPVRTAEALVKFANSGKPILTSWMGESEVEEGKEILNSAHIPEFSFPDTAARMFTYMWKDSYNLDLLYETPVLHTESSDVKVFQSKAEKIINKIKESGRTVLTEVESKELLAAYDIPVVPTRIAASEDQAVEIAGQIGFPVVLKLYSHTLTHKTDVGGVKLNLKSEDSVRAAFRDIWESVSSKASKDDFQGVTVQPMIRQNGYELILGTTIDPQFGPVILFGLGGQLVEVLKDQALAIPPLSTTLVRRMMERTQIYNALKGVRGRKPIDFTELEKIIVRFSYLVVEHRRIKEIDINPMLVSETGMIALDARVVLHDHNLPDEALPRLAIRPYPFEYISEWSIKDGTCVTFRPIRPEDEPLLQNFHLQLSDQTVYFRYMHMIKLDQRIMHKRLSRICFSDYDREMVIVAVIQNPDTLKSEIVAVGRLNKLFGTREAEFGLVVSDPYQKKGMGSELLKRLVEIGKKENISLITGEIHNENYGMKTVCQHLGFKLQDVNGRVVAQIRV